MEEIQTKLHDPQFFTLQSEKITSLLDVVVHESTAATSPDALIHYLELTEILTSLLDQTRFFSLLSGEELQLRHEVVRQCAERIVTLQDAVGDWRVRTTLSPPLSRKRARSVDSTAESMSEFKRRREMETVDAVFESNSIDYPTATVVPSIEESPAPWWTEPFYD